MNRDLLFNFYSFDMEKVNIIFHLFMYLLKQYIPRMHAVFKQVNISCSIFLFEWIVALYSNIFPLETIALIWDHYFFYGDYYLIKVAIAICACLESNVSANNFEMMVLLFKNVRNFVTEDDLFLVLERDIRFTK